MAPIGLRDERDAAARWSPRAVILHVAVVVCGVLLATGCTARQSDDQYEERLTDAVAVRGKVATQLRGQSFGGPGAYDVARRDLDRAMAALDTDPPPRAIRSAHELMVSGLSALGALLGRLERCEQLAARAADEARACRDSIDQSAYDDVRNDFNEADTIYRSEGYAVPGMEDGGSGDSGDVAGGEDVL